MGSNSDQNLPSTMEVPKECIAAVVVNEGPDFHVEITKLPVPEPGPDEILIKVNATGLCMSDLHMMMADVGLPKMSELGVHCAGHEGAGLIVKVGNLVDNLKVGQRVGIKPIVKTCGSCDECRAGTENYCFQAKYSGVHVEGTFKQYVTAPARYTTLIPDGVSDYIAGPIMCSASTAYSALKASKLRTGQWVVFPGGGGGVGIQGVQLAAAMGLRPIVVDTGVERQRLSMELGAEHFLDFKEEQDVHSKVLEITEGGASAVFVTAYQAYPDALKYLGARAHGQVVCIGVPPLGKIQIPLEPSQLIWRNHTLKGTLVGSAAEVDETLDFAKRGKLRLVPEVVGISKLNEALMRLKKGEVAGRIVMDFNLP